MNSLTPESLRIFAVRFLTSASILLLVTLVSMPLFSKTDFAQDYAGAWVRWQRIDITHFPSQRLSYPSIDHLPEVIKDQVVFQTRGEVPPTLLTNSAHPPFATTTSLPFPIVSWSTARLIWIFLGWASILVGWCLLSSPWRVQILLIPFWVFALGMGTFEPIVFVLLAISIRYRENSGVTSGIALGLATAIKIYPAVLIVGLWLSGYRRTAYVAVCTVLAAMGIGEVVMGFGSTMAWLTYMPINTAIFIDQPHNMSLPHLLRMFIPTLAPSIASLIVLSGVISSALTLPDRNLRWRVFIPGMLLGSPLCWGSYMPLVILSVVPTSALILFAVSGVTNLLLTAGLIPNPPVVLLITMVILPPIALIHTWSQARRRQINTSKRIIRQSKSWVTPGQYLPFRKTSKDL